MIHCIPLLQATAKNRNRTTQRRGSWPVVLDSMGVLVSTVAAVTAAVAASGFFAARTGWRTEVFLLLGVANADNAGDLADDPDLIDRKDPQLA